MIEFTLTRVVAVTVCACACTCPPVFCAARMAPFSPVMEALAVF